MIQTVRSSPAAARRAWPGQPRDFHSSGPGFAPGAHQDRWRARRSPNLSPRAKDRPIRPFGGPTRRGSGPQDRPDRRNERLAQIEDRARKQDWSGDPRIARPSNRQKGSSEAPRPRRAPATNTCPRAHERGNLFREQPPSTKVPDEPPDLPGASAHRTRPSREVTNGLMLLQPYRSVVLLAVPTGYGSTYHDP